MSTNLAFAPVSRQASSSTSTCAPVSNKTFNLQIEQGETLKSQITLTLDGVPVNLVGSEFQFTAKLQSSDADTATTTIKIDWTETLTPTTGVTVLEIPAATTVTMQTVDYVYQVRLVSSSNVVSTLFSGLLTITQPVSSRSE